MLLRLRVGILRIDLGDSQYPRGRGENKRRSRWKGGGRMDTRRRLSGLVLTFPNLELISFWSVDSDVMQKGGSTCDTAGH